MISERSVAAGAAAALYAIRRIRDCRTEVVQSDKVFPWHGSLPVRWDEDDARQLQAEVVEAIACASASSAAEFLTFRAALGLTSYYGQPLLTERAAEEVMDTELEIVFRESRVTAAEAAPRDEPTPGVETSKAALDSAGLSARRSGLLRATDSERKE
jgi:hypothetical protein